MIRKIRRILQVYHNNTEGRRIAGPPPGIYGDLRWICGDMTDLTGNITGVRGDVSCITGDVTGIQGDMTGIIGCVTGIYGNLDACGLTVKDREHGIEISKLTQGDCDARSFPY